MILAYAPSLLVEPIRLLGVFGGPDFLIEYPNGDVTYYTTIAFEARRISGSCKADGSETLDVRYFTKGECARLAMAPPQRIILARAFSSTGAAYFAPSTWSPPRS